MALLPEPISPDEAQEEEPKSPPVSPAPPRAPEKPPPSQEISPPPSHKIRFPLKIIVAFLVLGGFGAGVFFWINKKPEPQLAAKVGSEKITLEEAKRTAQNCKLTEKEATEYLVDEKVLSRWAKDENITPTPQEEEEEKILVGGAVYPNDPCVILKSKVNLLRKKLFQNIVKFREGKLIVVNFGLNNPPIFEAENDESKKEREKLLQEDRNYANQLIQSIYTDLKAKRLTFDEAMDKTIKDPKIGVNSPYGITTFQSGPFTATDYIEKLGALKDEEVRRKIDALNIGEFSEPFTQSVDRSLAFDGPPERLPQIVELRWMIARVEKLGRGYGYTEDELLKKTREKYKTVIYHK